VSGRIRIRVTLLLGVAALGLLAGEATATPSSCSIWFTPTDANPNYTGVAGLCKLGTGRYSVTVRCAIPIYPDYEKTSPAVSVGTTARVKCNWGNKAIGGFLTKL
jgi:hypothetical protein